MQSLSSGTSKPDSNMDYSESQQAAEDIHALITEYRRLSGENQDLKDQLQRISNTCGLYEPGHFYSPVPATEDLTRYRAALSNPVPETLPGIELNPEKQRALLAELKNYSADLFFNETQTPGHRYFYQNNFFTYNDAIMLYGMMRHLKPKRIIEVGSGFSSAVMLDVNDRFFNQSIHCEFIEPFPQERLNYLLRDSDANHCVVHQKKLQDVDLSVFQQLEAGDVLFIDSSHVSKLNSDVNRIFFEVLPVIQSGVHIHIHDIFYPFEYLPNYYDLPVFWNEAYMLRAFLMNNPNYEITLFGDYMRRFYPEALLAVSPLCLKDTGSHIWLTKH